MAKPKTIGIYKITSPSGRVYIGQSIDVGSRIRYYKSMSSKKQVKLYNSFLKYGFENHKVEIEEECAREELTSKERLYQEKYNCVDNGLNCCYVSLDNAPYEATEETRNKNRLDTLSRGEEWKRKLRKSKDFTEEHLDFLSESISKRSKGNNYPSKLVLDTLTGVFYDSTSELARLIGVNGKTLNNQLLGISKNKTNYKRV